MSKNQKNLRMILEAAIIKEGLSKATYTRAADQATDPSGRRALMGLAQAEAQHEQMLRELAADELPDDLLHGLDASQVEAENIWSETAAQLP